MIKNKSLISWSFSVFVLIALLLGYAKKQDIYDWWRLKDYSAPEPIATLASNATMTSLGTKLFYVHKPQLEDKTTFRQNCTESEQTIVLGCYITHRSIHIFDVTDKRLDGVEEVTSAHEMLHAAYDRLSQKDKAEVDSLIEADFKKIKSSRILDTVEQYKKKDPSVVPNELHSILGTEVVELSPKLENYYLKYFTDRKKVVSYSERYEAEFTKRQSAVEDFDRRLDILKKEVEQLKSDLEKQSKYIDTEQKRLNALLNGENTEQYNSGVDEFNSLVRSYNDSLSKLKQKIARFNTIVSERNALASEEQELVNAIDTRTPKEK